MLDLDLEGWKPGVVVHDSEEQRLIAAMLCDQTPGPTEEARLDRRIEFSASESVSGGMGSASKGVEDVKPGQAARDGNKVGSDQLQSLCLLVRERGRLATWMASDALLSPTEMWQAVREWSSSSKTLFSRWKSSWRKAFRLFI